jgi:hypothetical protein
MKQIRFAFCFAILGAGALSAQWLHQPTPGVPRLPDGRPNVSAAAPQTSGGHPDLSGMWRIFPHPSAADLMQQLKPEEVQPWALALRQQRVERFEGVTTGCLPLGPVQDTGTASFGEGAKFIQTPGEIVILYPDLTYRQVFLDGRKLERDPNPSWMGYSVGHWDGNTLVVESNGYNNRTWLDFVGLPHSEGLRVTERFQRVSFGMMKLSMTMEDPAVFSRPVQLDTMMQTIVDTEMLEYVCAENEKDGAHLTGKASDAQPVSLSEEELARFAGTYVGPNPMGPGEMRSNVTLAGGHLTMDTPVGRLTLVPLSRSSFSASGNAVRFSPESDGMAVIINTVEGELKAVRKP